MTGEDGKPVELGRGAMGVTYKAFDVDLRCPVTLKVISERYLGDESARLRFPREARAAAKVRHSNVASVLHLGRTEEQLNGNRLSQHENTSQYEFIWNPGGRSQLAVRFI